MQDCLAFWHRLTQVVLEKTPLNGCSSVVIHLHLTAIFGVNLGHLAPSLLSPPVPEKNLCRLMEQAFHGLDVFHVTQ